MRNIYYLVLLIPVMFSVLAVLGYGFVFRAAVSGSCAAILLWLPGRFTGNSISWIIAAFIISIGGDWLMSHIGNVPLRFIYGVGLFSIAHLGFLAFCLKNGRFNWWILAGVLAVCLIFFFMVLSPALVQPLLYVAVLMYLLVSCFSLAAAAGLQSTRGVRYGFMIGIGLLMLADTFIALKAFAGYADTAFLILPMYFASHIVITSSLINKS